MRAPHGYEEIRSLFGDPAGPAFEAANVVVFDLPYQLWYAGGPVVRSRAHRLMVPIFQAVFSDLLGSGLSEHARDYGGIYANRAIRGSSSGRRSTHAWGIAVDINPAENALGTAGRMHEGVIQTFQRHGFQWGGLFRRKDPMHFQYATGY